MSVSVSVVFSVVELWSVSVSSSVGVSVGDSLLADNILVLGLSSLDLGVVGGNLLDIVVLRSLTGDWNVSGDLGDNFVFCIFKGLDVVVLVVNS